jgi:hypothetical protein
MPRNGYVPLSADHLRARRRRVLTPTGTYFTTTSFHAVSLLCYNMRLSQSVYLPFAPGDDASAAEPAAPRPHVLWLGPLREGVRANDIHQAVEAAALQRVGKLGPTAGPNKPLRRL